MLFTQSVAPLFESLSYRFIVSHVQGVRLDTHLATFNFGHCEALLEVWRSETWSGCIDELQISSGPVRIDALCAGLVAPMYYELR